MTTLQPARIYRLESYEGRVFEVDEDVALQSRWVSRLAEEATGEVINIRVNGVDTECLRKVIEWCKMHTPAYKATVLPDDLRKWEDEYVDRGRVPTRLFMAAGYMGVKELNYWLSKRMMMTPPVDPVEIGRKLRAEIREKMRRGAIASAEKEDPVEIGRKLRAEIREKMRRGAIASAEKEDPVEIGRKLRAEIREKMRRGAIASAEKEDPVEIGRRLRAEIREKMRRGAIASAEKEDPVEIGRKLRAEIREKMRGGAGC
ncbi:hypothetical protein NL676_015676 [Syzygium grande]|nr:hypothetical protein NL676_015676 [Syzygium grande]